MSDSDAAKTTLTRADLYDAVYKRVGLSRVEASVLVEAVLAGMLEVLAKGESLKLSSFGTFTVREKKERIGRNPRTGEEASIAKRQVLLFRPSHVLKERISAGLSGAANETEVGS